MGVHVTPLFEGIIHDRMPLGNQLVRSYLERCTFTPLYDFSQIFDLGAVLFVPWANLHTWIPGQITWWVQKLSETIPPHERRVLRIAHRGASAYAQENSLVAFQKAAELGADMVEVDIRVTADRVPVVAHDSSLKRMFGVDGNVGDFTLAELRGRIPDGREPIPTFEEVAAACHHLGLGLYLDIKEILKPVMASIFESLKRHDLTRYTTSVLSTRLAGGHQGSLTTAASVCSCCASTWCAGAPTVIMCTLLGKSSPEPHKPLTPDGFNRCAAGLGIGLAARASGDRCASGARWMLYARTGRVTGPGRHEVTNARQSLLFVPRRTVRRSALFSKKFVQNAQHPCALCGF
jgi:hypothetical protein